MREGQKVPERNREFLSPGEVLEAIRDDFDQYEPQVRLYLNLCPLIFGNGGWTKDGAGRGVWIPVGSRGKMQLVEYGKLGDRICARLESDCFSLEQLALICRQVFRTRTEPGRCEGVDGIWVETGMEAFSCSQCGRCCRVLGYPKEIDQSDVDRWQTAGRQDILKWVGLKTEKDGGFLYRIWITPGTNRPASACPWLETQAGTNRYRCRIHEVKPEICRQYPGSRKHALMTGCRGFEAEK